MASNQISLVVTVSRHQNARLRKFARTAFMDMQDPADIEVRLLDILLDMTDTVYSGERVLVHCIHGLHRTGALVTLWLALALAGGDFRKGLSKPEDLSTDSWTDILIEAWNLWADKRQLDQATAEGRHRRDFAQESWDAMLEYWQGMPTDQVAHFIDRLRKHARNADHRLTSRGFGSSDIQARLSIGSSLSSTDPAPPQRVVLRPRTTPTPPSTPPPLAPQLQSKQMPVQPKSMPKQPSVQSQLRSKQMPVQPKSMPKQPSVQSSQSLRSQQSQQSEQPRKKPRGSAAVEVPGAERDEAWVPGKEWQAGDWRCRVCNNHNWRWRGFCNGNGGRCKEPRDLGFGPQDWYCRCGNWNLKGRAICNRDVCRTPRSKGEQQR